MPHDLAAMVGSFGGEFRNAVQASFQQVREALEPIRRQYALPDRVESTAITELIKARLLADEILERAHATRDEFTHHSTGLRVRVNRCVERDGEPGSPTRNAISARSARQDLLALWGVDREGVVRAWLARPYTQPEPVAGTQQAFYERTNGRRWAEFVQVT